MAIFTISDLHLSLDTDKSMEVFGYAWNNYIQRIYDNWTSMIGNEDTVIVGGDISWAMHLKDCKRDFSFLNSLPGKKLLFKGNHDYWWESMTKMNAFAKENGFDTFSFMQNNCVICEDALICGTRGWSLPADGGFGDDDRKIYQRELLRLELSFEEGNRICKQTDFEPSKRICVFHYPPFSREGDIDAEIIQLLKKYSVTHCIYGHLHSAGTSFAVEGVVEGIQFYLASGDYIAFSPIKL